MKKLIYSVVLGSTISAAVATAPNSADAALGDGLLKQGMNNSDVKDLQQQLKNKGYFKLGYTTTYFGTITKDALKNFQRANGLAADGIAGKNTYRVLLNNSTSSSSGTVSSSTLLKYGMSSPQVKQLQSALKQKGYFNFGYTTNYYGTITRDAVIKFQRANGLAADGIAGPKTLAKLNGSSVSAGSSSSSSGVSTSTTLRLGMSSPQVQKLQSALKQKGYFTYSRTTNYYGTITRDAVMKFQRAAGLAVDGVAGPKTLAALNGNTPVAESKPSQGSGSSSSSSQTTQKIISIAKSLRGVPYVWGGTSTSGFDCSGFIQYVFNKAGGPSLPRTVAAMYDRGTSVSSPKVGDLVFFETYKPGASHAGIYLGNSQFIHAGSSTGVTISSLHNTYWAPRYLGAKTY
ncbi:peptidoglycan-binding protein [Priestia endophytica]|jgi:peptidoglycan hydrolase-like protein with peptidoglycan-binding domain|uniref:Peptidase n=1 Tax=Priestia endophytica TaxID=135735 RepID=A0AAX1QDT7_9BACI|nr:peptidoglycan-binding protein [Priestia endophytica]MCM3538833.1 peptidoglycan-binding protein [Priestia endophytica]RAS82027.1 peptidase [Priestia endophytica]RAS84610.1 peptidase [Priestia endophytica]